MRKMHGWRRAAVALAAATALAFTGAALAVPTAAAADEAGDVAAEYSVDATGTGAESIDGRYMVRFELDPYGGLSASMVEVALGEETLSQIVQREDVEVPKVGDIWRLGDRVAYRFERWSASNGVSAPDWGTPLQASDFATVPTDTGEFYQLTVTAEWAVYDRVGASAASAYGANGLLDAKSLDAWRDFVRGTGADGFNVEKTELNAAQQAMWDTFATNFGCEQLAVLDIALDEYLSDGSSGYLDVAKHDLPASAGVSMELRLYQMEYLVGSVDLNDVIVVFIPEDGATVEEMASSAYDANTLSIPAFCETGTYVLARDTGVVPAPSEDVIITGESTGATVAVTVPSDDVAAWSGLAFVTEHLGGERMTAAWNALVAKVSGVQSGGYVYDLYLQDADGGRFEIPAGTSVTVTLPIPASMGTDGVHVFHVDEDGTVTDIGAVVDAEARTATFTTSHFSTFVIAQVADDDPGTGGTGTENGSGAGTGAEVPKPGTGATTGAGEDTKTPKPAEPGDLPATGDAAAVLPLVAGSGALLAAAGVVALRRRSA